MIRRATSSLRASDEGDPVALRGEDRVRVLLGTGDKRPWCAAQLVGDEQVAVLREHDGAVSERRW